MCALFSAKKCENAAVKYYVTISGAPCTDPGGVVGEELEKYSIGIIASLTIVVTVNKSWNLCS